MHPQLGLIWSALLLSMPPLAGAQAPEDLPTVLPDSVPGVMECRSSLNGIWEFSGSPGAEFWNDPDATGWVPVQIPGEPMMQGLAVAHDTPFAYRKFIPIARGWAGKRIVLRFNGVYGHARVWVNGHFVRDHDGGFTSWECDITPLVTPGHNARLVVGLEDRLDDISFGSGYAKHPIGGILRSVELLILPPVYPRSVHCEVQFDSAYRHARLELTGVLSAPISGELRVTLLDPSGHRVPVWRNALPIRGGRLGTVFSVPSPEHWNAEHPRLYTLTVDLLANGNLVERVSRRIGFREVRVEGRALLVNGKPVKLRGACRHDMHPLLGRSTTPEQDRLDVQLAREANINFIRTSHYPPSSDFLDACDEIGIYVEEETAVCFVGTHRQEPYAARGASENDPAFSGRYLSQLREMVARDRDHPSVILWSIGNENEYGANFQREYDEVRRSDPSRPVMFSYPGKVAAGRTCFDIVSIHYVDNAGRANQYGIAIEDFGTAGKPVLHDEWAHVACYNTGTLRSDPNVRNFWGESLKRMWDGCFQSDGGVGGAIWGFVDETFNLPDTVVGYGQWGIIDVWRRMKPEFWHTRKAYSPVRVEQTWFPGHRAGEALVVPVWNRFDHTNLSELLIRIGDGAKVTRVSGPEIPPHSRGEFSIPAAASVGDSIMVQFLLEGTVVDEEMLTMKAIEAEGAAPPGSLEVVEREGTVSAVGKGFAVSFDRSTGLIVNGAIAGRRMILSGPYLHLSLTGGTASWAADSLIDLAAGGWVASSVAFEHREGELRARVSGHAGTLNVSWTITVDCRGEIRTVIESPPAPEAWREIGVAFLLSADLDSLSWQRESLWSTYPNDHIGRPSGTALKLTPAAQQEQYRVRPDHPWSSDGKDFFLFGWRTGLPEGGSPVPADFRATKERILRYALVDRLRGIGLEVVSDGAQAARAVAHADGTTTLLVLNAWNYRRLAWGNYEGATMPHGPDRAEYRIHLVTEQGTR